MPLDLYNVETKTVESVPDSAISQAVASGKYTPRKDAQIPAIAPNGELGYLEPEKAAEAFKNGFTYDTKGLMSQKIVDERNAERFDHPIVAGALAAADTLGFGLPSQVLTRTGVATPGQLDMLAENNPVATPVGTGVGLVGGLLTGSGAPGAIAKGTSNIERQIAAKIFRDGDGPIKALAGKVLSKTVSGGAEGLAYGTSQFIREEAMGKVDFNAESFLNYQKPYVLWGSGLGAATGVLAGTVPPAYRAMSEKIKSLVGKADDLEIPEGAARAYASASAKAMGRPEMEDTIFRQLKDKTVQKNVRMTPDDVQGALLNQAERTVAVMDDLDVKIKDFNAGKLGNIKASVDKQISLDSALKNADDVVSTLQTRLDEMNAPSNIHIFDKSVVAGVEREKEGLRLWANRVRKGGESTSSFDVFNRVNNAKQALDEITKAGQRVEGYAAKQTYAHARESAQLIREQLQDTLRWGQAGETQQALNQAFSNVLRHINGDASGEIRGVKDLLMQKGAANLVKARNMAKKLATDQAFATDAMPRLEALYSAFKEYDDIMTKHLGSYSKGVSKEGAQGLIDEVLKGQATTNQILSDRAAARDLMTGNQGAGVSLPEIVVGGIGGALGGGAGAAAAFGLAKLFTNPGRTTSLYMAIKSGNLKVAGDIARGVKNFFAPVGRAASRISPVVRPASTMALARLTPTGVKAKSREEGYQQWAQFLGEYQANPERILDNVSRNVSELSSVMPQTGSAAQRKVISDLDYLASKIPTNPNQVSPFDNHLKEWAPNKEQLANFERIVNAVHNPLSVVDHLRKNILTKDEVDAVRATRPEIYNKMLESVTDYIAENSAQIPFNKKANLSVLFGVPFDSMLTGSSILNLQKNFMKPLANEQTQYPNQGPKVEMPGATANGFTETQRLAAKREK